MNTHFFINLLFALTLLYSCNSKQQEQVGYGQGAGDGIDAMLIETPALEEEKVKLSPIEIKAVGELPDETSPSDNYNGTAQKNAKKIIKDGSVSLKSNDIQRSKKDIDDLIKELNAYYEREDLQNNDQTITYDLRIRVPANKFEQLISSIENGKDEVIGKNIQARDVTEEYIDIETRLANKREYLARYKQLLSKALTVKDILAIEENIRTLQEEIESKEGRLNYLNDQISFSTLNIVLYKEKEFIYKQKPQDKFSERVKTSLSNGWISVINFILWTITIWPYIILTVVCFLIIRRVIKKRKSAQS